MAKLAAGIFIASLAAAIGGPVGGKDLINSDDHIAALNKDNVANSTWLAGENSFFDGMTYDDALKLLGTQLVDIKDHLGECLDDSVYAAMGDFPDEFDARTKWPGLIHPIRDQQRCGSCWAFSAAEVLGDRASIAAGKPTPVLSPEDLVSCDTGDMGCSGGQLPAAWSYLKSQGIVSDKCLPYTAGTGNAPKCPRKCVDGENWGSSKVRATSAYAINGVTNMQKEIMTNGPVQVAFMVYKSFMSYKSGVYQKHFYELLPEGGHAVKILGWGTETSSSILGKNTTTDYWLVANSWNTNWGMDGFFKIKRGNNDCGIEKMGPPYAGMPAGESLIV